MGAGLILDVDNTLTTHDDPTLHPEIAAWLDGTVAGRCGHDDRLQQHRGAGAPLCGDLGLPYVADGKKPGTDGMRRAAEQLGGLRPEETAVSGDQIFTDVWGGNRFVRSLSWWRCGAEDSAVHQAEACGGNAAGAKPQPLEEV